MPTVTKPDQAAVAQAKSVLVCAANAVDPLSGLRRRPFASIALAAAAGAILGMSTSRLVATARLSQAISSALRSIAYAAGQHVAARPAHATARTP